MKKENDSKNQCFYYQMFMERAYGVYESPEPGMQASVMEDLIMAENQRVDSIVQLIHYEKQILQVKDYMESAMSQYLSHPKLSEEQKNTLRGLKSDIIFATSSENLMGIILQTIDATVNVSMDMA